MLPVCMRFHSTSTPAKMPRTDVQTTATATETMDDREGPRYDESPTRAVTHLAAAAVPPPPTATHRRRKGFKEVQLGRFTEPVERFAVPVVYLCRRCFEERAPLPCEWSEKADVVRITCSAEEFWRVQGWTESNCRHGRHSVLARAFGCFAGAA